MNTAYIKVCYINLAVLISVQHSCLSGIRWPTVADITKYILNDNE